MKVIDAYTGTEVKVGDHVPMPGGGSYVILKVNPGVLSASADVWIGDRQYRRLPLRVRWLHPAFFGQHVAFVPS